jgi:hypothetical protein
MKCKICNEKMKEKIIKEIEIYLNVLTETKFYLKIKEPTKENFNILEKQAKHFIKRINKEIR